MLHNVPIVFRWDVPRPSPSPSLAWQRGVNRYDNGRRQALPLVLRVVFKSVAIHPLRNIGSVSRSRLWANTDSAAHSPWCMRGTDEGNGPHPANIWGNVKANAAAEDALPHPAISVCLHDFWIIWLHITFHTMLFAASKVKLFFESSTLGW